MSPIPAVVDVKDGHALIKLGPMDYGHRVTDPANGPPSSSSVEVAGLTILTISRHLGRAHIGLHKNEIEGHEKVSFSADCGCST
jgi:hypothetical protein